MLEEVTSKWQAGLQALGAREVFAEISEFTGKTGVEKRIRGYYLSRCHFIEGDFVGCLRVLKETQGRYGNHVAILSDMTTCYYFLGDMVNFKISLLNLSQEYYACEYMLSDLSYVKTATIIGKFAEETAEVFSAQKYFRQALERARTCFLGSNPCELYLALAQLIRVEAEFNNFAAWSAHYFDLVRVTESLTEHNFNVEVAHALFIAESSQWGLDEGLKRLSSRFELEKLCDQDKDLFVQEIILQALKQTKEVVSPFRENLVKWRSVGHLTKLYKSLYFGDVELVQDTWRERHQFSNSDILRLIPLMVDRPLLKISEKVLKDEQLMLLGGLTQPSQGLWKKLSEEQHVLKEQNLKVNPRDKTVSGSRVKISLRNRQPALAICLELSRDPSRDIESLIKKVWQVQSVDESYFHRLRMQVKRLNASLFKITSRSKSIMLSNNVLSLSDGVFFEEV